MANFFILLCLFTLSSGISAQLGLPPDVASKLRNDSQSINASASDWGHIIHNYATAVLNPNTTDDIATSLKFANNGFTSFNIAARGHGHSARAQAMAKGGVVVNMTTLNNMGNRIVVNKSGLYADVGGKQLWIDVLKATVDQGLTPVSWTDYLYLTVGGTLSNAGISGHTFRYGPQITNVYELDVVTGKGDIVTCSSTQSSELFYAALGGLGQVGIITRARVALQSAPKRAIWLRLFYSDFATFTKDQELLIASNGKQGTFGLDYVEGFVLMQQAPLDLSFYPVADQARITALLEQYGILYTIEIAKYYDTTTSRTIAKVVELLLKQFSYIPGFIFQQDVSYIDFLNRVYTEEQFLRTIGLWEIAHPWMNLFVPKSRIADFDTGVFKGILLKEKVPAGLVLVYPMNRNKCTFYITEWDDKMSAVVPDEDVFYVVALLHSSGVEEWQPFDEVNSQILQFCNDSSIAIKQYLPHYEKQEDWTKHFGSKLQSFQEMKVKYDPNKILAPGQRVFDDL